jgi:glycosyltransferase involved in cell wall biosynthesis
MRSTPPDAARSEAGAADSAGATASANREATVGASGPRLRVLISAYACDPSQGSEPGIGWNIALEMARRHDVWLLTRANNRPSIEREMARAGVAMHPVYYDLPRWAAWWKHGSRGIRLYYYLWQIGAYFVARRVSRGVSFDLVNHVTFGRYWAPSFVALLPAPFIWGPVGGGEAAPRSFLAGLGRSGRVYELARTLAKRLGELDPFVRLTAKRSRIALATTEETAERLRRLRCSRVEILGAMGMSDQAAAELRPAPRAPRSALRFLSTGRLLCWKGFHLGIEAFAGADLPDAELWIIGDGPERARLETLSSELGVAERVRFLGALPRAAALAAMTECDALVHPSLHDSGGWVCVEAMLLELPVLCLDLGGPATMVSGETGFIASAESPESAVRDLRDAMRQLARSPALARQMGRLGRERALAECRWSRKGDRLDAFYRDVAVSSDSDLTHRSPG